jgi:hypothetical protein
MWLLEFMLVSLVGGTILGVSWRLFDEWRDRAKEEARLATSNKTE